MFPVVKVRVSGLNPKLFYEMKLEFVQIGSNRWKYMNGVSSEKNLCKLNLLFLSFYIDCIKKKY